MLRLFVSACCCLLASTCFCDERVEKLPTPHYHPQADDPPWLSQAVQFHGHLGPTAVLGVRMGMAALKAVDARGYFDVDIVCEGPLARPPASCFLDGLQVGAGATLGKRNLHWVEGKSIVVRVKNTRSGKTATLRPRVEVLAMLPRPTAAALGPQGVASAQADAHESLDAMARKVAAMPEDKIAVIERP